MSNVEQLTVTPIKQDLFLTDEVIIRCVEIFQEAMCMGIDGTDLFKQMRLNVDYTNCTGSFGRLVLSPEYKQTVKTWHEQIEANAHELAAKKELFDAKGGTFIDDSGSSFLNTVGFGFDETLLIKSDR